MSDKEKLKFENIPFNKNLLMFDDIGLNIVKSGLWFNLEDDTPCNEATERIYTTDRKEFQWHVDFARAYEWVEDNKEIIQRAMEKEMKHLHGDVHQLFSEYSDYIDKLPELKRRVKKYLSYQ